MNGCSVKVLGAVARRNKRCGSHFDEVLVNSYCVELGLSVKLNCLLCSFKSLATLSDCHETSSSEKNDQRFLKSCGSGLPNVCGPGTLKVTMRMKEMKEGENRIQRVIVLHVACRGTKQNAGGMGATSWKAGDMAPAESQSGLLSLYLYLCYDGRKGCLLRD